MATTDDVSHRRITVALIVIAISLLIVGAVSGTILRHVVQIIPLVAVVVLARQGWAFAPPAAAALFLHWLVIVVLIWLYLLGVSRVASGHYSMTEVGLTFVMAVAAIYGSMAALTRQWPARPKAIAVLVGALLLQYGLLILSFTAAIAHD